MVGANLMSIQQCLPLGRLVKSAMQSVDVAAYAQTHPGCEIVVVFGVFMLSSAAADFARRRPIDRTDRGKPVGYIGRAITLSIGETIVLTFRPER